jgi:hypothetical protein
LDGGSRRFLFSEAEMKLTDTQVADLYQSEVPWNIARRAFSTATARIDQIAHERALSPLELRRMEFEAVADIARALGILLTTDPDPAEPARDPGPSPYSEREGRAAPEAPGGRDPAASAP